MKLLVFLDVRQYFRATLVEATVSQHAVYHGSSLGGTMISFCPVKAAEAEYKLWPIKF